MSNRTEEIILKKTTVTGAPKMRRILELECMIEGCSAEEIAVAIKKLISEGRIFICRTESFIKKV